MNSFGAANVRPAPGKLSMIFNQGLELYFQGYFRKALHRFQEIRRLNGDYPQLDFYIAECNKR